MGEDCEDPLHLEGLMVKHMGQDVRQQLSFCLNHETVSKYWKHLADNLGYRFNEIQAMEDRQSHGGSHTEKLLADYGLRLDSTVANLRRQLEAISRPDAVEELDNAIPDIRKAYLKEKNKNSLRGWSLDGHKLPSLKPGCTSCHTCNDQPEYYRMNSAPSGIPQRNSSHRHMSHSNGQQRHTNGHTSRQSINQGRNRVASSLDGSGSYQLCAGYPCSSTGACHSVPRHHQPTQQFNQSETNASIGFHPHKVIDKIQNVNPTPFCAVEDNNVNCSMEVCHSHSNIHARHRDFMEVSPGDGHGRVHNDRPLPLEQGLLRCVHNPADNVPPLMPANNMDVGAEEEVFTSNESSMSSDSYQGIVFEDPSGVTQQILSSRPLLVGKTGEMSRRTPRSNGKGSDHSAYHKKQPLTNMARTNGHMTELKTSKNVSKMMKNGTCPPSRLSHSHSVDRTVFSYQETSRPNHVHRQSSMSSLESTREPPSNRVALPARAKPKLSEVCRGEVKVFVTYAADTEKHKKHVYALYDCLKENGFSPYLDCHNNELFKNEKWDQFFKRADFVLICVSPLYKVLTEGSSSLNETMTDCDSLNGILHTRLIFNLMRSEFSIDSRNRRFIPLLCRGATHDHVPSWLQDNLIYKWPDQFRDLLWKLTKPQERASPCARR